MFFKIKKKESKMRNLQNMMANNSRRETETVLESTRVGLHGSGGDDNA